MINLFAMDLNDASIKHAKKGLAGNVTEITIPAISIYKTIDRIANLESQLVIYKKALENLCGDNNFGAGIEYCPARYSGKDIDAFYDSGIITHEQCDDCETDTRKKQAEKCWALYFIQQATAEIKEVTKIIDKEHTK